MYNLQFLFEDSDLFAVYKPAGIHSVRLPSGGGTSLADLLLEHDPTLSEASRTPLDAGLVQRLDFETSGIMLGAKRKTTWDALFEALVGGTIKKSYLAIVEGALAEPVQVSTYIGSPHRGARKMRVYTAPPPASARALEGMTEFSLLRYDKIKDVSVVHASASPARRHQIRAHAAHLGHPLLGDSLYGSTRQLGSPHNPAQRQFFLHASALSLRHPASGEEIIISSEPFDEIDMLVG